MTDHRGPEMGIVLFLAAVLAGCGVQENSSAEYYPTAGDSFPGSPNQRVRNQLTQIGMAFKQDAGEIEARFEGDALPAAAGGERLLAQGDQAAPPAQGAPGDAAAVARQIVYAADLKLAVEDFQAIPEKVTALVEQYDAVIAHSQIEGHSGSPRSGSWRIRVPVRRYGAFLTAARTLGEVRTATVDSKDVSEEYYDVEARIRNKEVEEARLIKHLQDTTGKLDEILQVERELSRVREELERMQGRMRVLKDLVALTTVTLHVDEIKGYVPAETPTLGTRLSRAFSGSLSGLSTAGENLLIAAVAVAPWMVVLAVPAGIAFVFARRRRAST